MFYGKLDSEFVCHLLVELKVKKKKRLYVFFELSQP